MKLNIMKDLNEQEKKVIQGTKDIIFTIPILNLELRVSNWRKLHNEVLKYLYDNHGNQVKIKLIENSEHVVSKRSGLKQYRYCSFNPKEVYEGPKHYSKIYSNFYIYNYYENPQNALFIRKVIETILPNISEVYIEFEKSVNSLIDTGQEFVKSIHSKDNQSEDIKLIGLPNIKSKEFIGIYTSKGIETFSTKVVKKKENSPKKIDFDKLSKSNKTLGNLGEVLVFNDEVDKVSNLKLNKTVEHVSITQGDGLGYDIISFDGKGEKIYIEVKTTKSENIGGFYLSLNEKLVCEQKKDKYKLYRVYSLDVNAKTYNVEVFNGIELLQLFDLKPVSFFATIKK